MELKQIEVYSQAPNAGVVKMPERAFPGIVIQGDSLAILVSTVQEIAKQAQPCNNSELEESISMLQESLQAYQAHYEGVLKEHEMKLPYPKTKSS